jgi:ABC-type nitrate/sulfonate/bicarbonate transport system substrate-binding protein
MKRTLLTLALVAAAGTAGAQTASAPAPSADTNIANTPTLPLPAPAATAQKRIEQDGYKNVRNVQKGADGLWHGTAMRGSAQVQVTVDRSGHVEAR